MRQFKVSLNQQLNSSYYNNRIPGEVVSSLEYEISQGNQSNGRRWQDTQFCYSDNEKQLIEEMKKMKRDHNESIQAYEERISKLMAKMHELREIRLDKTICIKCVNSRSV
jgi:hypothetical protein